MNLGSSNSTKKNTTKFSTNWLSRQFIAAILLAAFSGAARVTASELRNLPLSDLSSISATSATGSRFHVDLPDGTSCSSTNGTPPTLNLYSGYSLRSDESQTSLTSNGDGYAVGAVVTVPLFTSNSRNCDEAYALNIANKKLELATFMFQEELLSEKELRAFVEQIKQILLLK
jgi:hypothetical protein